MNTQPLLRTRFRISFHALHSEARRLLEALGDPDIARPVLARLPSKLPAEFAAQVERVATLGTNKTDAIGTVAMLTQSQQQALAEYNDLASVARRAALLAFRGQAALLHGEFRVGAKGPRTIAAILDRGRSLVAACQNHPEELGAFGWPATETAVLESALTAVTQAGLDQSTASDLKETATAIRVQASNVLYQQCLAVQNAARGVYSKSKVEKNPALVAGRARFLLDEFPRRRRARTTSTPTADAPVLDRALASADSPASQTVTCGPEPRNPVAAEVTRLAGTSHVASLLTSAAPCEGTSALYESDGRDGGLSAVLPFEPGQANPPSHELIDPAARTPLACTAANAG